MHREALAGETCQQRKIQEQPGDSELGEQPEIRVVIAVGQIASQLPLFVTEIVTPRCAEVPITDSGHEIGQTHVDGGLVVRHPVVDRVLPSCEERAFAERELAANAEDECDENQKDDEPRLAAELAAAYARDGQDGREAEPDAASVGEVYARHGQRNERAEKEPPRRPPKQHEQTCRQEDHDQPLPHWVGTKERSPCSSPLDPDCRIHNVLWPDEGILFVVL